MADATRHAIFINSLNWVRHISENHWASANGLTSLWLSVMVSACLECAEPFWWSQLQSSCDLKGVQWGNTFEVFPVTRSLLSRVNVINGDTNREWLVCPVRDFTCCAVVSIHLSLVENKLHFCLAYVPVFVHTWSWWTSIRCKTTSVVNSEKQGQILGALHH